MSDATEAAFASFLGYVEGLLGSLAMQKVYGAEEALARIHDHYEPAVRRALASPPNGAERDALDARRYRVLRDGEWEEFDSAWLCKVDIYGQGPADLDAAIDAALTP